MVLLERGFKTWCERVSVSLREDLALPPYAPLPAVRLAELLEVRLLTPFDIPGIPEDALAQLLERDPSGWSAVTLVTEGQGLIIYNPRHSRARQSNDITHELAHLFLDHEPATMIISHDGAMAMRTYDRKQEEEANWLAGCLLLPREALIRAKIARRTGAQIADEFGISQDLVSFRLRMTGVNRQFGAHY